MICKWQELQSVLPVNLREFFPETISGDATEIRLHLGQKIQLVKRGVCFTINHITTIDDLNFIVNTASKYSPWTSTTTAEGFLTAAGGHRIGLCGNMIVKDNIVTGIRQLGSICIRIAKDYPGCSTSIPIDHSILILGAPGAGKTTLMRDLIRRTSQKHFISVIDDRGELFPKTSTGYCFDPGSRTDVLSACSKRNGVSMLLRSMGPEYISMDEITSQEDTDALISACWCGVKLFATAHAASVYDLQNRPIYKPLVSCGVFRYAIVLQRGNNYKYERIPL